jgi:D-arabinose 1-dehydrogenase-like Zn-dependent alcohol dehydrogenase
MLKMRAMIVPEPGGRLRMEERDLPEPGGHEVRIRVYACGVCHSDSFIVEGHMPGLSYPRIPGHEVIGVIDALGPNVDGNRAQQRFQVQSGRAAGRRGSSPPSGRHRPRCPARSRRKPQHSARSFKVG